ncbi:MAG: hypothetical protein WKF79_10190 [Nocardioides sp.]
MEFNGLPLHALVTHAAVVFGPLSALTGLAYAAVSRWRDRLRWPLVVTVAIAVVSIWFAYLSGESVEEANTYGGPLADLVETHEARAGVLRLVATAFGLVSFGAATLHAREGVVRIAVSVVVGALAVATGVYVVLTGDAGAHIAWYGKEG